MICSEVQNDPKMTTESNRTANRPAQLARLSNPMAYADGAISFRIERHDGASFSVSCSMDQLADMFSFLALAAKQVSELADIAPLRGPRSMAALPADAVALGTGPNPTQSIIVWRIGGFDLALSVPNSELAKFGLDLAQKVQALAASGKPQ
jgi:hypothetical protein